ncbi:hypothetical protein Agabi119p4_11386 [Agaricus bisporus var. burnettii]|uniref:F-box domain-containing protein n=1 Tax=Agaricus bisporus var. burnettii TaxID=192524 RepID=A0A8H7BXT3_AGABI|nr:hypothetical protein Agabi119p4_11386 [Agaricus bisporus var. burnettii]
MSGRSSIYQKLHATAGLTNEAEVRRVMGRTLKKLEAVEMEIAGLQDRLIVLGQRKQDTESFIEVHEGFLSPIRRLVPEILQEIFWLCLPVAHNSVLSAEGAPLVLGRVCSQWRRIAYSTPKLWCSLHITVPPLTYPQARAMFEASEAWIARSGILPLSISISNAKWMQMSMDQFRPYFELITKHARRWRSIRVQIPFADMRNFLMELDADNFPLLEGFHVDRGILGKVGMLNHPLSRKDGILSAPSLRVLSINKISRLLDLPVQWSLLKGLDLMHSNLHEVFEVLTLCSNLEACSFRPDTSPNPFLNLQPPINRPNISLSKLRTLRMLPGRGHVSLSLLNNLAAPALRHFACSRFLDSEEQALPSTTPLPSLKVFRSFFQKLNQPLEELELNAKSFTTRYLMEFLSLLPGLKRLSCLYPSKFDRSPLNDRLLSGFIPSEHISHYQSCSSEADQIYGYEPDFPSSSTCLCPNLEVLNVDHASLSKHVLLEYLRSRLVDYEKYNVARLRCFNISFKWRVKDHDSMMQEVDRLAGDSGLVVEFGHNTLATRKETLLPPPPSKYSPSDGIRKIFGV